MATREYHRQWRADNPDKVVAARAKYMGQIGNRMMASIKHRAKKKGLPFDLLPCDLSIPTHCPILGMPLVVRDNGWAQPDTPSVDRIVPELGYVKGNVQVVSRKANAMKLDATPEELLQFAEWINNTYGG